MAAKSFIARKMTLAQAELATVHTLGTITATLVKNAFDAAHRCIPKSRIVAEWKKINGL